MPLVEPAGVRLRDGRVGALQARSCAGRAAFRLTAIAAGHSSGRSPHSLARTRPPIFARSPARWMMAMSIPARPREAPEQNLM